MTHRHVCACGSFYVCHYPAEICQIRHWDCPTCEQRELDRYITRLEADTTQPHATKESPREHQHRIS